MCYGSRVDGHSKVGPNHLVRFCHGIEFRRRLVDGHDHLVCVTDGRSEVVESLFENVHGCLSVSSVQDSGFINLWLDDIRLKVLFEVCNRFCEFLLSLSMCSQVCIAGVDVVRDVVEVREHAFLCVLVVDVLCVVAGFSFALILGLLLDELGGFLDRREFALGLCWRVRRQGGKLESHGILLQSWAMMGSSSSGSQRPQRCCGSNCMGPVASLMCLSTCSTGFTGFLGTSHPRSLMLTVMKVFRSASSRMQPSVKSGAAGAPSSTLLTVPGFVVQRRCG